MILELEDEEAVVENTADGFFSVLALFLTGRELGTPTDPKKFFVPGNMSPFEEIYVLGKATNVLGLDAIKNLGREDVSSLVSKAKVPITQYDRERMRQLMADSDRWLKNRSELWQKDMRKAVSTAERDWAAVLGTEATTSAESLAMMRESAVLSLMNGLAETSTTAILAVDTMMQTEMSTFFQMGQISDVDREEEVYKIPRDTACDYCLDLHLNEDGSYKIYKLSEVEGNSNVGLKANEWQFTIGPVHPHCYCILKRVKREPPGGSNAERAKLLTKTVKGEMRWACRESPQEARELMKRVERAIAFAARSVKVF